MIAEKRISTIDSLKEIVVFLAALTFTNAISTLLLDDQTRLVRPWASIRLEDWLCFLLLIFGLIRFYHGNARLLDENYKIGIHRGGILSGNRRNIIWFDFISVLTVALIFSLLSFYVRDFSYFVCFYVAIIVVDIVWLYFTNLNVIIRRSAQGFSLQTGGLSWFYNNISFLILLIVFVIIGYAATAFIDRGNLEKINDALRAMRFSEVRWLFWVVTILILFNSVVDFRYNWQLYFPDMRQKNSGFVVSLGAIKRIFLAAPFTQLLQQEHGSQSIGDYRVVLESIIDLFDANNIEVFNAHKREAWGEKLQPPAKALGYDLDEIARSDLLVMIIGSPPSPGVQLELGYAVALNKPIVLLSKKGDFVPYLVRGLAGVVAVKEIEFRQEDEIIGLLKKEFVLH